MTDFFTKLAGRTLGKALSPRPVIAPLFAPGPGMVAEYAPENAQDEALLSNMPGNTEQVPSVIPLSVPQGQIQPTPQTQVGDYTQVRSQQNIMQRLPDNNQLAMNVVPELREQPTETTARPEHTTISLQSQANPPLASPSTTFRPQLSSQTEAVTPSPAMTIRPQISHQAEAQALIPVATHTQVSSVSAVPTIRVTIGRIDVRAVPAPAPTSKQRTPSSPPQPSLEAYLQARNRGKR